LIEADKKYIQKLIDLALSHGGDLTELQMFIETLVDELGIDLVVPNLWDLRERLYAEED